MDGTFHITKWDQDTLWLQLPHVYILQCLNSCFLVVCMFSLFLCNPPSTVQDMHVNWRI